MQALCWSIQFLNILSLFFHVKYPKWQKLISSNVCQFLSTLVIVELNLVMFPPPNDLKDIWVINSDEVYIVFVNIISRPIGYASVVVGNANTSRRNTAPGILIRWMSVFLLEFCLCLLNVNCIKYLHNKKEKCF